MVVFFDIGQTLATGTERSARRLLASRLGLSEKETKRVGRLIMTHPAEDPFSLASALSGILPGNDPSVIRDAVDAVWAEQIHGVREVGGATALLTRLKALGVGLGVISNTWYPSYQGFRRACPDIVELLDFSVLSYRTGCKKPGLEIYELAVRHAGERASSCWMVGDTYEMDVAPAMAVGMPAIWLLCRPERERDFLARVLRGEKPAPDWAVDTLDDLVPFFERRLLRREAHS